MYGDTNIALISVIADTMLEHDGQVIDVISDTLVEKEGAHPGVPYLCIVCSGHENNALMAEMPMG
jgi:hypothetical protein